MDSMRNLRTSEIELQQRLPQLERDWLVSQLRAHRGIAAAICASDEPRLTIEYDADRLDKTDLVDLLNTCGVRVGAVHPRHR